MPPHVTPHVTPHAKRVQSEPRNRHVTATWSQPILLFFGLFIIFLQRAPEIPAEDDLSPVDDSRQLAALAALTFCLLTLVPYPGGAPPPTDGFM